MQLQTALRKRAKIKMGLQGPAGSGKTFSALLAAYGLCKCWEKIAVVDTENHSADLFSHLGSYKVLGMSAPYTPEKFIDAISFCEKEGMEVIILDSASHEWQHLLESHSALQGNSFTNWDKITPRHNSFVQKILQSPVHIITTMRSKQDYVLNEKNGKMIPEKVGLKSIQREGLDYELTLVFELDMKNFATAAKDRTQLFFGKPQHIIGISTGEQIAQWCDSGAPITVDFVSQRIGETTSIHDLLSLYQLYPQFKSILQSEYEEKKRHIMLQQQPVQPELNHTQTFSSNGVQ